MQQIPVPIGEVNTCKHRHSMPDQILDNHRKTSTDISSPSEKKNIINSIPQVG